MLLRPMLQRLQMARHLQQVLRVGMHDLMSFLGADRGNVQLLGRNDDLVVVAQHGLSRRFLDAFRRVSIESSSVCGRAAAQRSLVFVPDVSKDAVFADHLPLAEREGITSILSLPLTAPQGDRIGMISAHFAQQARPTPLELDAATEYGAALAQALGRLLPRQGRAEVVESMADVLASPNHHGVTTPGA